jgi:hypothetical protein
VLTQLGDRPLVPGLGRAGQPLPHGHADHRPTGPEVDHVGDRRLPAAGEQEAPVDPPQHRPGRQPHRPQHVEGHVLAHEQQVEPAQHAADEPALRGVAERPHGLAVVHHRDAGQLRQHDRVQQQHQLGGAGDPAAAAQVAATDRGHQIGVQDRPGRPAEPAGQREPAGQPPHCRRGQRDEDHPCAVQQLRRPPPGGVQRQEHEGGLDRDAAELGPGRHRVHGRHLQDRPIEDPAQLGDLDRQQGRVAVVAGRVDVRDQDARPDGAQLLHHLGSPSWPGERISATYGSEL